MKVCNCALPAMNGLKVCENCANNQEKMNSYIESKETIKDPSDFIGNNVDYKV